ncbi:hypothetical protein NDU88_001952 [Pleurodeles waltl]|uniref:Uncharacterized protein n=1 Tax=Pleurodeles waltl TaxID=8319 RepID=A0AAV7MME6_PLEWA|nr:hypothetical protein NDU88_001952 [Pleurodeles waltl]
MASCESETLVRRRNLHDRKRCVVLTLLKWLNTEEEEDTLELFDEDQEEVMQQPGLSGTKIKEVFLLEEAASEPNVEVCRAPLSQCLRTTVSTTITYPTEALAPSCRASSNGSGHNCFLAIDQTTSQSLVLKSVSKPRPTRRLLLRRQIQRHQAGRIRSQKLWS